MEMRIGLNLVRITADAEREWQRACREPQRDLEARALERAVKAGGAAVKSSKTHQQEAGGQARSTMTSSEYFETCSKKGRGMAQRSLDLIEAMYAKAEAAQPITGRGANCSNWVPL